MKNLLLLLFLAGSVFTAKSQKKAVTETGEEVILYENGTWKYSRDSNPGNAEIPTNKTSFKKHVDAGFLVKSTHINMGIWLNAKKWSFKKAAEGEDAEYEFELKGKDLYGMMITEKIEIPLETLKNVALENARSASPDAVIAKQEYRTVNGKKMLMLQLNGSSQGIKFSYCGYYYSNEKGTVQLVLYTAQNLMKEYEGDIEEFLNGLAPVE